MAKVQLRLSITWTPGRGGGRILSQRAPPRCPCVPSPSVRTMQLPCIPGGLGIQVGPRGSSQWLLPESAAKSDPGLGQLGLSKGVSERKFQEIVTESKLFLFRLLLLWPRTCFNTK